VLVGALLTPAFVELPSEAPVCSAGDCGVPVLVACVPVAD
jgi:hypothetical protein